VRGVRACARGAVPRYPMRVLASGAGVGREAWLALADAWPWAALAAGAAAGLAVAIWLVRRRLRRRPARLRRVGPRYPVVLAHGILGFDEIRIGRSRHGYFRGVSQRLEQEGCVVHTCRVAKTASIADRAAELAAFVREIPAKRVNLVAHSMGGLDARYALSKLGLSEKVASLVTVGTPHHGTPLADVGTQGRVFAALGKLGVRVDAFHDLTTHRMDEFNAAVPDARGILYASVVGAPPGRRDVTPLLVPTWVWLDREAGANDGMVPAASQRWGEVAWQIRADHLAQIGWSRRFDAPELYAEIARELRARGL
jgi:triacylglycerol lipase